MNAFEHTNAIMSEAANGFDVLRIIAKDTLGLSKEDRASINVAADELEDAQRRLVRLYVDFCELQQRLIAVNEQLIESRKSQAFPSLSLTTGPLFFSPFNDYGIWS